MSPSHPFPPTAADDRSCASSSASLRKTTAAADERNTDGRSFRSMTRSDAPAPSRLKLVYSNPPHGPFHCNPCKEKKTTRRRSRQIEDLASIFAREVCNPLSGLYASLQFALSDLARAPLQDTIRKRNVDLFMVEQTIHGALREVDALLALLNDFRSRVSLPNPKRKNSGQTRTLE